MANPTNTRQPTSHIAPFGVRMQPELKARLEAAAKETGRSMNAEIIARLEQSFAPSDELSEADRKFFLNLLYLAKKFPDVEIATQDGTVTVGPSATTSPASAEPEQKTARHSSRTITKKS